MVVIKIVESKKKRCQNDKIMKFKIEKLMC